jgi:hypothetical protein
MRTCYEGELTFVGVAGVFVYFVEGFGAGVDVWL